MDEQFRDDAPELFSLNRRRVVVGGTLMVAALGTGMNLHASSVASGSTPFMALSHLLIDHHLDDEVGRRIAEVMAQVNPHLSSEIDQLLFAAKKRDAKHVEDFFDDIPEGPAKATALAIISAWYLGVVVDSPDAKVVSYELALMYQPTIDVMTIPTYAISGPNGWNASAPPIGNMPKF